MKIIDEINSQDNQKNCIKTLRYVKEQSKAYELRFLKSNNYGDNYE